MDDSVRHGIEQFTGAYHPVVWIQSRSDADLPPWKSELDGQYFMDNEVQEIVSHQQKEPN